MMIEVLILGSIWFTLFLGIVKLRVDLNTINENLMHHLSMQEASLMQIKDEVVYLHQDLQDEIKKALGGTL